MDCIFCQIVRRELKTEVVYQDEDTLVFKDIRPLAPVHLLIIPKEHVEELYKLASNEILSAMLATIKKMIEQFNLADKGYKIEVNGGGAQIVNHLHFHLLGPVRAPNT